MDKSIPYKYAMKLLYNSEFRASDKLPIYIRREATPQLFIFSLFIIHSRKRYPHLFILKLKINGRVKARPFGLVGVSAVKGC
jgi:hypothetical protein